VYLITRSFTHDWQPDLSRKIRWLRKVRASSSNRSEVVNFKVTPHTSFGKGTEIHENPQSEKANKTYEGQPLYGKVCCNVSIRGARKATDL